MRYEIHISFLSMYSDIIIIVVIIIKKLHKKNIQIATNDEHFK